MPNHSPENLLFSWIALRVSDLTPSFGDLSQSEKLSEIKQPLENIKDQGSDSNFIQPSNIQTRK